MTADHLPENPFEDSSDRGGPDRGGPDRGSPDRGGRETPKDNPRRLPLALHQPPNGEDLRRHPPESPECARMREQMRDFADGDLARDDALAIEEHVHGCRTCALSLGRVEHETMRLRQAFRLLSQSDPLAAAGSAAPRGLRDAVLRRLLEETADGVRLDRARGLLGMESEGGEAGRDPQGRPNSGRLGSGSLISGGLASGRGVRLAPTMMLALGACLLVALVSLQFLLMRADDGMVDRTARLVITSAQDVHGLSGQRLTDLSVGEGLGDDQLVFVGARGAAQADLHDASQQTQPAATLLMDSNAAMRLRNGEPVLVHGNVDVETHRPVEVALADGGRIQLGNGRYRLSALDPHNRNQAWDPLRNSPEDLAVHVQVLSGDEARLAPFSGGVVTITEGGSGVIQGGTATRTSSGGGFGSVRQTPAPPQNTMDPPLLGSVRGVVWERTAQQHPVGADVHVTYLGHGLARFVSTPVGIDGSFQFATGGEGQAPNCDSPFAIVQLLPPQDRPDLGITMPDAHRLALSGQDARLVESLVLDQSTELTGRVVDQAALPIFGVRIVPCVVDDVFGTVLQWREGMAVSGEEGLFHLLRLPFSLPRHQHLVLVAQHPDHATGVVPVPTRGNVAARDLELQISLADLSEVAIEGIAPNATVELWQDIEGLPPGTGARLFSAHTDVNGRIPSLRVGSGALWLRNSMALPNLRELVRSSNAIGEIVYRPANGAVRGIESVYAMQQVLPATGLALASSYRHRALDNSLAPPNVPPLRVVDSFGGNPVANAQVFAVQATGPRGSGAVRFLGFSSQSGVVNYARPPGDSALVAIGVDGEIGVLDGAASPTQAIEMAPSGRVQLGSALRPAATSANQCVAVRFVCIDVQPSGMAMEFYRFASPGNDFEVGSLPPGRYEVTVGAVTRSLSIVAGGRHVLQ